jgi:hypothetical protein
VHFTSKLQVPLSLLPELEHVTMGGGGGGGGSVTT